MSKICWNCKKELKEYDLNGRKWCRSCNAEVKYETPISQNTSMEAINEKIPEQYRSKLFEDEIVYHFSFIGFKGGCMQPTAANQYIMVTNTRVLYNAQVIQNNQMTLSSGSIPLEKVSFIETLNQTRAQGCSNTAYTELRVNSGGGHMALAIPNRAEADRAKSIIELLARNTVNSKQDTGQGGVPAVESIPDQIRKLSELKDQGILSEEEFTAKKSELLSKM